jgi:hypothetical protein
VQLKRSSNIIVADAPSIRLTFIKTFAGNVTHKLYCQIRADDNSSTCAFTTGKSVLLINSFKEENISVFSHMVLCQYYDLWWQPSWISDRHKKQKLFRGPSNDYSWAVDPMGKCSNAIFSETTNMIKAKLYMNVHWMVLYKL